MGIDSYDPNNEINDDEESALEDEEKSDNSEAGRIKK